MIATTNIKAHFFVGKGCRVLERDLNKTVTSLEVRRKKKVMKHQSTSRCEKQVLKQVVQPDPDSNGNTKIRSTIEVKVSKLSYIRANVCDYCLQ